MQDRPLPKPNAFADAPAAIAKRFGVSAKALRIYERMGLISPTRTAAGWRAYGRKEIERLAAVVALKQLGLPLKRIAALVKGDVDLASVLELQQAALEQSKAAAEEALALVKAARARLAKHEVLSTDELAKLIRRSKMSEFKWTPEMEKLAQKHYTPDQLAELRSRPFTGPDQARVSAAWASAYEDLEALGPKVDPKSEAALAIGRRAFGLINEFTQGDPALFKAVSAMKKDMLKDATLKPQMPAPEQIGLLGQIFAELKKRGDIAM